MVFEFSPFVISRDYQSEDQEPLSENDDADLKKWAERAFYRDLEFIREKKKLFFQVFEELRKRHSSRYQVWLILVRLFGHPTIEEVGHYSGAELFQQLIRIGDDLEESLELLGSDQLTESQVLEITSRFVSRNQLRAANDILLQFGDLISRASLETEIESGFWLKSLHREAIGQLLEKHGLSEVDRRQMEVHQQVRESGSLKIINQSYVNPELRAVLAEPYLALAQNQKLNLIEELVAADKREEVAALIGLLEDLDFEKVRLAILRGALRSGKLSSKDLDLLEVQTLSVVDQDQLFFILAYFPRVPILTAFQQVGLVPSQPQIERMLKIVPAQEPLFKELVQLLTSPPNLEDFLRQHQLEKVAYLILAQRFTELRPRLEAEINLSSQDFNLIEKLL